MWLDVAWYLRSLALGLALPATAADVLTWPGPPPGRVKPFTLHVTAAGDYDNLLTWWTGSARARAERLRVLLASDPGLASAAGPESQRGTRQHLSITGIWESGRGDLAERQAGHLGEGPLRPAYHLAGRDVGGRVMPRAHQAVVLIDAAARRSAPRWRHRRVTAK